MREDEQRWKWIDRFVKIPNVEKMKGKMIEKIYVWTELSSLLFLLPIFL